MTKERFHKIREAARELLRLRDAGAAVGAEFIEWAEGLLKTNAQMLPPFKPSPNQDSILATLQDAPTEGYTAPEIGAKTGMGMRMVSATLSYMVKMKRIGMIKIQMRSRYFANQAALDLGRALVMADENRRKEAKAQRNADRKKAKLMKPPKPPRPIKPSEPAKPRHVPKPMKHQALRVKEQPAKPQVKSKQGQSVFIPPDLVIQQCPSNKDTRFTPEPGAEGAGFSAEWKRLRAAKT